MASKLGEFKHKVENDINKKIKEASDEYKKAHPEFNELPSEIAPGRPLPATPPGSHFDYLVGFTKGDPLNPMNWPLLKKVINVSAVALQVITVAWGSASIGPGVRQITAEFHVSSVVAALLVSLYVAGFAVGPIIWGPCSEAFGRKFPLFFGLLIFVCFTFAAATAKDFQTLVLSRFFMGAFGSASLVVGPAIAADTFDARTRGTVVSLLALAINAGPMISPVVSGYIAASYLKWRWTMYITGIIGALSLVLMIPFNYESYGPIVLKNKARQIRIASGNWAISAPIECVDLDPKTIIKRTTIKPMYMLTVEPMLLYLSLYNGFIYGILYLCLEAVPLVFINYGWHGGNVYLPYFAFFIGAAITIFVNIVYFEPSSYKRIKASGHLVVPEERFRPMMLSGVIFPIGIFLFTWAGAYKVHWIVPSIGLAFLGYGLIGIFLAIMNALIDIYLLHAASALAANTFIRSGMGAAFPLFASIMFKNLGTQWAGTLLGCLAVVFLPAPFIFYFFGPQIRSTSKHAIKDPSELKQENLEKQASEYDENPIEVQGDESIRDEDEAADSPTAS